MKNTLCLEIASLPENVGVARVTLAAFAALDSFSVAEIEEIKVAVSEAVTNAIVHGYRDSPGVVMLRAELEHSRLCIVVEDTGVGIEDIEQARKPAFSTDPERMGLGFVFMESFMDELEVVSAPGAGTRVRMTKTAARHEVREGE